MANKPIFWHGAHTMHRHMYHIVFVPKYRRKVLHQKLIRRLSQLFYQCCKMNRWFIHELEILPDHVHMLLQLPHTITVPRAVQYLKGGSSKVIRKEFPDLEEFLWGDSLWADGYFSETVGRASESVMREYIKSQWQEEDGNKPRPLGRGD